MSIRLIRRALYKRVWSTPRTTLAKDMGVSDVWIAKQCRALNVRAPRPGTGPNAPPGASRRPSTCIRR